VVGVEKTNKIWSSRGVAYIAVFVSILTCIGLVVGKIAGAHINFSLEFNVFSLLSFASAFVDIVTIGLILSKNRYSPTTNWFLLFLFGATLAAIGEGLQRSSVFPEAAMFWQTIYFLGYALLPPVFYLFIVSYTAQTKKYFIILSSVLIFTWGVIVFFTGNGLFYLSSSSHILHAPWGYFTNNSHIEYISLVWFVMFYILGTALLLEFRKANQNLLIKKQGAIFAIAFLMPFVAAIITSVILPAILPNVIPPLAIFVGGISGIYVYYGIYHYSLFDIDPQAIAQNILNTMSEAVIITRPDLSIESINPEAERLLGTTTQMISNKNLKAFFSDDDWKLIIDKITNKPSNNSSQLISKSSVMNTNGKFTPVRLATTSLINGGERMANIIVLSDISELTKSFDELQQNSAQIYIQNQELQKLGAQLTEEKANIEQIVEVRTKELTAAQERLKNADQLKTEFIMLTSHNLRTPLAIADGYTDMLKEYYTDPNPQAKELIDGLKSSLRRLGIFVEDLLAISSLESGDQYILEEVSFQKIMEPLIVEVSDLALTQNDKVITSLHSGDVKLKANRSRLQGALRNVLNNAVKFTKNGTVEINTSRSENKLIINISDTGIGINAQELPNLFTKFHRATNVLSGGYEGEGVGLYLTKLIVEEHKGRITCVSELGKGSTFTVELPCY
jgi:PAS domain S-box-containing protein